MTAPQGRVERAADRYMPDFLRPFWEKLRASNIGYRLAHGAFWSTTGAAVSQALMLLTSIILARMLGKEQFGEYGMVFSTVGMFNVVAGFGLGTTATKFVAEYRTTDPARAGRIIGLSSLVALVTGVVASLALVIMAHWLAKTTLAAPALAPYLQIGTGILFFSALNGSQVGALAGFEAFRSIARINLLSGVITFPCVVTAGYIWGLKGVLGGQVVVQMAACVINHLALRTIAREYGVPLGYKGCWQERSVLISFSLPAVLSGIMVSPVNWACAAMLVNQPNGYAEMGVFNAANSWQKAILFFPNCIGAIALPMLSSLHGTKSQMKYNKTLWYNIIFNSISAFTLAACIAIFAKMIMASYGQSFSYGSNVLILLAFTAALTASAGIIGQAAASIGKMWWSYVLNMIWALVVLFFVWSFKGQGAYGLALSYFLSYLIHFINVSIFARVYIVKKTNN